MAKNETEHPVNINTGANFCNGSIAKYTINETDK
jgi:hypothetical protein